VALFLGVAQVAQAKTDGILIVGTQAEVAQILKGTEIRPVYNEVDANAMVAVKLAHGKMYVYEGGAVETIIKFVGKVVHGGVVFTLEVGSKLWDLLENTACFVVHVGQAALKATCWVLKHTTCLVVDGVTFVAKTFVEILKAIFDLLP
jgi:hypothetical protein